MRALRAILWIVGFLVIAVGVYLWRAQWPLIGKIEPPARTAFAPALIETGARLAAVGDCRVCHTAPGGADYAGNRPIPTPFGTIYSTNITPAPGSGIGHWSKVAFRRAMRSGIARTGAHLYPAFPYPHFAAVKDTDLDALYAFMMTRHPVETTQLSNKLRFPFGQRWLLSFWDLLYLHPVPFRPDRRHDAQWNRGAYLVEGLGHCGDCHTPRDPLGAEERRHAFAGGESEDWPAWALDPTSPAPQPWTAAQLYNYLRQGWDKEHGAAAGPMQPVAAELAEADPADVRAIAGFIAAREAARSGGSKPPPPAQSAKPEAGGQLGAILFAGACAGCHTGGAAMLPPHGIDLAHSSVINAHDPRGAILVVLDGLRQRPEEAGPFMPGFAATFTDPQIAALLSWIRAQDSRNPAWRDLEKTVQAMRHSKGRS